MAKEFISRLAFIDIKGHSSPIGLFQEWFEEAKQCGYIGTNLFNLATSSRSGEVSNRTMTLKEIKMDRFVFTTRERNKKHQQISENPNVAVCFYWHYKDTNDKSVSRQVRIEGVTESISRRDCEKYFNSEPLYHQIRYHICDQGKEVDWNQLKEKHDQILEDVKNGKELKLPELYTGYKIIPENFDFFYSSDSATIADRIIVIRGEDENAWKFIRVAT